MASKPKSKKKKTKKSKSTKRRKKTTSISMSKEIFDWAKNEGATHGMCVSGYIEYVLREERKRLESPPDPVKLVTIDPHTGNVIPFQFGEIRNA